MIGATVMAYLADNYGRKKVLNIGWFLFSIVSLLTFTTDNVFF